MSCEDDKSQNTDCEIKNFSHTECKPRTKSTTPKEYLELKADGKYLKVKHVNAEFNCCPKELLINSKISNDTIFVFQDEKEFGCNCVCRYDLNYNVGTLEYGTYHFILNQQNSVLIEFNLEFNTKLNKVVNIGYKNH